MWAFYFSEKIRLDISCGSYDPHEMSCLNFFTFHVDRTIHMKCHVLISLKTNKFNSSATNLFSTLKVKDDNHMGLFISA